MKRSIWPGVGRIVLVLITWVLGGCAAVPTSEVPAATGLSPTLAPTAVPLPTMTPAPELTAALPVDPATLIRWTYATKGAVWGAPTVAGGVVYVGSDDGCLYAVDDASGTLIWAFATQGIIRSQPASAQGRIFISSDDGYVYAIDSERGTLVWRTDIGNVLARDLREQLGGSDPSDYDYRQSSPVVAEDKVFVGSFDGRIYALALDAGEVLWTYQTQDKVRATSAVVDGTVYVGSWDRSTYALDAATGDLRWKTNLDGQIQSTALLAGDLLFTASRRAAVFALDRGTGEKVWDFGYGLNLWVESSAVLAADTIYIGSSGSKMIYGFGTEKGSLQLMYATGMFCWATPVVAGETLLIGCTHTEGNPQGLFAYAIGPKPDNPNLMTLTEQWHLPMTETLEAEGTWYGAASGPVLSQGVLYFGGLDGVLYALSE